MKVILAGCNVETALINRAKDTIGGPMTPEVISAAYARISRDPRNVDVLRRDARRDVERARKSNERIVFEYGHSSVAEHTVFNFDIMQISRLAVEELERFRLASFTEKSQRYIKLGKELVIPGEVVKAGMKREFTRLMNHLHNAYGKLFDRIISVSDSEEIAREDARYLMPLAASAQLGMTVNARELEYMTSRLASHPLEELRELGSRMARAARSYAPSLIRYHRPTDYFLQVPAIQDKIAESCDTRRLSRDDGGAAVRLIDATRDGDTRVAASMIFSSARVSYREALRAASRLSEARKKDLITETMRHMQHHDSVWREFESIHVLFEVLVSASCYAQLKRHRMAMLITQPYSLELGVSIPRSVRRSKAVSFFRETISSTERMYRSLRMKAGDAADYTLTNAHRRRVLVDMNMRELYHFVRLRSDPGAQWEIREISDSISRQVSASLPACSVLLCGRGDFDQKKHDLFT